MKFLDLVRARADERAMRGLSRNMLLVHIRRALDAFGDERAVEIVTELERRLPSEGRNNNSRDVGDLWVDSVGRETHIHDLDNGHLLSIIDALRNGRRRNGDPYEVTQKKLDFMPRLIREAVWRGLDVREKKQCATCQVWIYKDAPAWKQGCDCQGREPR